MTSTNYKHLPTIQNHHLLWMGGYVRQLGFFKWKSYSYFAYRQYDATVVVFSALRWTWNSSGRIISRTICWNKSATLKKRLQVQVPERTACTRLTNTHTASNSVSKLLILGSCHVCYCYYQPSTCPCHVTSWFRVGHKNSRRFNVITPKFNRLVNEQYF